MKPKLLIIVSMFFSTVAFSQSVKTLEYNVGTGVFNGLLPFDQPFNLKLTNIDKNADSVRVQLIEVPKKNYHAISKAKRKNKQNWKELTKDDVIKWNPNGIETLQYILDTLIKGKNLNDTFQTLAVPFYLKPESKYLIEVKSFTRRDLTEAETQALENEIKNYKPYKELINQLINQNLDTNATSEGWGDATIRLQNMAQQVIKAKHPNYGLNDVNYETQLNNLSGSLLTAKSFTYNITTATGNVADALKSKTDNTIEQVVQRHATLQNSAAAITWPKVKEGGTVYNKFFNQLNSVLNADSLLLSKADRHFVSDVRNNVIQKVKDVRAKKFSMSALKKNIADKLSDIQSLIYLNLKKIDGDSLNAVKKRHNELTRMLKGLPWAGLKTTSPQYKNTVAKANDVFTKDEALMPADEKPIITDTKDNITEGLQTAIEGIEAFTNEVAHVAAINAFMQGTIGSTNSESLVEQAKLHVTFDLGYAYVWQVDRGNPYAGINIYFRSIDTSLSLKNYKTNFLDFIGSRTSLLVGMSVQSIQKDSVRKGIIGNNALVLGLGFRLLPWFKINGGAYMYYLYDRNMLRSKNDYSFKASPFVSLSIDFNLSSFFNTFGNGSITNIFKQ
jgi:hypothetical protein